MGYNLGRASDTILTRTKLGRASTSPALPVVLGGHGGATANQGRTNLDVPSATTPLFSSSSQTVIKLATPTNGTNRKNVGLLVNGDAAGDPVKGAFTIFFYDDAFSTPTSTNVAVNFQRSGALASLANFQTSVACGATTACELLIQQSDAPTDTKKWARAVTNSGSGPSALYESIVNDAETASNPWLIVTQTGGVPNSASFQVPIGAFSAASPYVIIKQTTAPTDTGAWRWRVTNGGSGPTNLYLDSVNDAQTAGNVAMQFTRTGSNCTAAYFGVPIGPPAYTVATLPTVSTFLIALATNGRKIGEGVGAGTGQLYLFSNSQWRRVSDDAVAAA